MQTAAKINLVLTDSSSLKRFAESETKISYGGFYQLIASGLITSAHKKQVFRESGDRLVVLAEQAHAFRQLDTLEQVSQILVTLPLPRQYEAVGRYYQALCIHRFGRGDVERAAHLLERVAQEAPPRYRAKVMLSMGSMFVRMGDNQTALSLYREASRCASRSVVYDPYDTIHAQRMVAVISSEDGNHRHGLALLENLLPVAHSMRLLQPHVYYDYMNSLAVELCEVGRLEEAKNVSKIVLASPFAGAYPEWRETREDIELRGWRASRSTVAISTRTSEAGNLGRRASRADPALVAGQRVSGLDNLVFLPAHAPDRGYSASPAESIPGDQKQSARVLEFKSKKMPDESKHNHTAEQLKKMMTADKLAEIMNLISQDISDSSLDRVILLLEEIARGEEKG
ncbi:MAG: hypothetical protein AABN33_14045 [Acidobacteriota bacterium]